MTWQTFFDFSTMAHRHLVFVYVGISVVQLGYVCWIAKNWAQTGPRNQPRLTAALKKATKLQRQ